MNPLFASHLIADFLFQTDLIAELKQKYFAGILAHGIIHAVILSVLLFPASFKAFFIIFFIAATHALIDHIKVTYQKKKVKFELVLILDQLAHFAILLGVALVFPMSFPFWNTGTGESVLGILFFMSFAFGIWNLLNAKEYHLNTTQSKIRICLLLTAIFLLYLIPAKMFAI